MAITLAQQRPLMLTADELAELTGYRLAKHQARWLEDHGWTFTTNKNRQPIVARGHFERMLGCAESTPTRGAGAPNFDALRAR